MAERRSLFTRAQRAPEPALPGMTLPTDSRKPHFWQKKDYSVTDAVLVGVGVGLAAACATFPWYVFMNQEQFGYAALKMDDSVTVSDTSGPYFTPRVPFQPKPVTEEDLATLPLDFDPTGTVVGSIDRDAPEPGTDEQPFPQVSVNFRLVHVANGRAMISDENGFFVVERGSVLPDSSRVVSIERHAGTWRLKTSRDQVVELAE